MYAMVVIGFSAGGIEPMRELLRALGSDYPLPLAVVAHLPPGTGRSFTSLLTSPGSMPITIAEDKQIIVPGYATLAPADYHLLVENNQHFALSVDAPTNFVRPSIDVLFESAAEVYGQRLIGLTLSSASSDGAKGMAAIRQRGGMTITLTPDECRQNLLAEAVLRLVDVDYSVGLQEIITLLKSVY